MRGYTRALFEFEVTWAIGSEPSTVIGAFTFNGRATVVDNRGLQCCEIDKLGAYMPASTCKVL